MLLNTNESRVMHFDVNIQGVDYQKLQGSLKFRLEGVEYGFPVSILQDHIEVEIPPLDGVIKKGLKDGNSINCQLDIFGEGFYMMPWTGQFDLKCKAIVEAKMSYNEPNKPRDKKESKSIKVINSNISENKEVKKSVDSKDKISENDTERLMKMLEKLVKSRMENEESKDDNDSDDDNKKLNKEQKKDLKNGINGNIGKRTLVTEPPPKQVSSESKKSKKYDRLDLLINKVFESNSSSKLIPKVKKPIQKTPIIKKPIKEKFTLKDPSDSITKKDVINLFESVGMTKVSSQNRLIELAKKMGGTDIRDIYQSLRKILYPQQAKVTYENYFMSKTS